jgi:hypothetical protein
MKVKRLIPTSSEWSKNMNMPCGKSKERSVGKGMKEDELNNLRTYLANAVFAIAC